jgi:hypothetical protein
LWLLTEKLTVQPGKIRNNKVKLNEVCPNYRFAWFWLIWNSICFFHKTL